MNPRWRTRLRYLLPPSLGQFFPKVKNCGPGNHEAYIADQDVSFELSPSIGHMVMTTRTIIRCYHCYHYWTKTEKAGM